MKNHLKLATRVMERIEVLALISEDKTCLTRTYGSKAFVQAAETVASWMTEAGLETRRDNIGNVRGQLRSGKCLAKTFVMASHIDTVVNAGKFDGPLGVLIAIELAANLKPNQANLPFNLEIIAFCVEEGVRFHTTYLGSKVVTGQLEAGLLNRKDDQSHSVSDYIWRMGGKPELLPGDSIASADWLGYFEIHIEQGPVLYEKKVPAALVTGIAGQKRAELIFTGCAGHAGTVPMNMRSDALCAASEFIIEVERFALVLSQKLVATVGKLHIAHSASNVIPGTVTCSLDVRSGDEVVLDEAFETIRHTAASICHRRKVHLQINLAQETPPVKCNETLNKLLTQAIVEAGFPVLELASGAGHDAVPVSQVAPVAMLFVKCFKGISHNPLEDVALKDIAAALKIAAIFINLLVKHHTKG